jgi:hypothetical protein
VFLYMEQRSKIRAHCYHWRSGARKRVAGAAFHRRAQARSVRVTLPCREGRQMPQAAG